MWFIKRILSNAVEYKIILNTNPYPTICTKQTWKDPQVLLCIVKKIEVKIGGSKRKKGGEEVIVEEKEEEDAEE